VYNGNPAYEKVLLFVEWRHRLSVLEVSKYWLRKMILLISLLTDFTIKHHFQLLQVKDEKYLAFLLQLNLQEK
jgi:hypothetical protein